MSTETDTTITEDGPVAGSEECAWCGAETIAGERVYRRRADPRETYCSRSHRDAATAAVKALHDHYEKRKAIQVDEEVD